MKKYVLVITMALTTLGVSAQNDETLRQAFSESYAHEADSNYLAAINTLNAVYNPASYHLNARLGWLNYMAGQLTQSVAFYQKAIELKPYAIEARFGLTYPASAMGNWAQVRDMYIKILEVDPQNTTANYYFGLMHYESGDYEQAARHFEKVVNLYPFDMASVLMYAWSNFMLGKTREAEVLFNEVLIIDPANESALEGLGKIK